MTDEARAAPDLAPKVDPETLVLRGSPARVVRFRRGAIIGMAALGSAALIGVTWAALKPATFRVLASNEQRGDAAAKTPPDALADAPKTYGDVPMLGPPLPGDLGRPILEHQRSIGAAPPPDRNDQAVRAAERAEAERQRIASERKAARESGVMMRVSESGERQVTAVAPRTVAAPAPALPDPAVGRQPRFGPEADTNVQALNTRLSEGQISAGDVYADRLTRPASSRVLSAGSTIAASLITGLNSDLPGLVTAQVTQNAYDSSTGRTLLIPQGSRLIGSYDSVVAFGQRRALVVWQLIILPDGSSIPIDNAPASDTAGFAGLADKVDFHTWQLLKGVALSTLLGVGTELGIGGEGDLVRAIRESTQQGAARAGDRLVSKSLNLSPTITVRPGWPLRVVLQKDLVVPAWRG